MNPLRERRCYTFWEKEKETSSIREDYSKTLLIGPETTTEGRHVEAVDCELCDAVMQTIVGAINASDLL